MGVYSDSEVPTSSVVEVVIWRKSYRFLHLPLQIVVGLQEPAVAEDKSAARNHLVQAMAYATGIEGKRD